MLKRLFKKVRFFSLVLALPLLGIGILTSSIEATTTKLSHQEQLQQTTGMDRLATLMAERIQLSEDIATYEWNHKLPIDNHVMEKALLDERVLQAKAAGVDEELAQRFFIAQVEALNTACIDHFETWVKKDVHKHPYTPEIAALNQKLDQVDHKLIVALKELQSIDKVALIKALQDHGLTRDVIDASINF